MGALTESEIFDCLSTNFKLAAEHAQDLGKLPRKGPTYTALRNELGLIEGACRQASVWREDSRWLTIGLMMAEAHKRAGSWLRGVKTPTGVRIAIKEGQLHPLFMKLADNLRAGYRLSEQFRTSKTNKIGLILPQVMEGPHRDTRPVHISVPSHLQVSKGGIIIPDGARVH